MEHFFEAAIEATLETLFGFIKAKPEQMPSEVQYKENFTVFFNKTAAIIILLILAFDFSGFLILAFVMKNNDAQFIFILSAILLLIVFFLQLFIFSLKTKVTPEKIIKSTLFVFKKEILWQDIICLRIIEKTDSSDVTIALYNKDKKCIYDVFSNYENSWLLVKMAENKNIEIRKEKDLSLKQISKLNH